MNKKILITAVSQLLIKSLLAARLPLISHTGPILL